MQRSSYLAALSILFAAFVMHAPLHADTFSTLGTEFDIDFVSIGSPGEGGVDYEYRIGKFEINREQVGFSNQLGGLGLELFHSETFGPARPEMPAAAVSTNEAARFVNWLNEIEGFPHAYKFEQQPGEEGYSANAFFDPWQPDDPGYDPDNVLRNSQARYVIPSDDEWVKAAYFRPGVGLQRLPGIVDGEEIVYQTSAPVDVMDAGTSTLNGVVGIIGNVWEINESPFSDRNAVFPGEIPREDFWQRMRGGGWTPTFSDESRFNFSSSHHGVTHYDAQVFHQGFRVASVPEPTFHSLWLVGLLFVSRRLIPNKRKTG